MNLYSSAQFNRNVTYRHFNVGTTPVELVLNRLSGVKQIRPDRWQARCPTHDDQHPSVEISEVEDGNEAWSERFAVIALLRSIVGILKAPAILMMGVMFWLSRPGTGEESCHD